jgi:hypothetical protein
MRFERIREAQWQRNRASRVASTMQHFEHAVEQWPTQITDHDKRCAEFFSYQLLCSCLRSAELLHSACIAVRLSEHHSIEQ